MPQFLIAWAGFMGASGVALAAAGAHEGGGDLTRLAAEFLLIHAVVLLSIGALTQRSASTTSSLHRRLLLSSGCVLGVATGLFSGDLALAGLMNWHPLPIAAPIGGTGLLLGWLGLMLAGIVGFWDSR